MPHQDYFSSLFYLHYLNLKCLEKEVGCSWWHIPEWKLYTLHPDLAPLWQSSPATWLVGEVRTGKTESQCHSVRARAAGKPSNLLESYRDELALYKTVILSPVPLKPWSLLVFIPTNHHSVQFCWLASLYPGRKN